MQNGTDATSMQGKNNIKTKKLIALTHQMLLI